MNAKLELGQAERNFIAAHGPLTCYKRLLVGHYLGHDMASVWEVMRMSDEDARKLAVSLFGEWSALSEESKSLAKI